MSEASFLAGAGILLGVSGLALGAGEGIGVVLKATARARDGARAGVGGADERTLEGGRDGGCVFADVVREGVGAREAGRVKLLDE